MTATAWNPQQELGGLRWKEDMRVVSHFGDLIWLKPHYMAGRRIGITDCCFDDDPCPRHAALARSAEEAPND